MCLDSTVDAIPRWAWWAVFFGSYRHQHFPLKPIMRGSIIEPMPASHGTLRAAPELPRIPPVKGKPHRSFQPSFKAAVVLTLIFLAALLTAPLGRAWQQSPQQGSMSGMDMHSHDDMSSMGPSMAAMAGHMYMTPLRSEQPGDLEKAKSVVAEVRATIERYKDYRKALLDGYVIANPKL